MGEHVDVLIVGAGLSGIGAAHHLQRAFPSWKYVILESRDASGGTWDLFRYPGVRSDSSIFTLSFPFEPVCACVNRLARGFPFITLERRSIASSCSGESLSGTSITNR